MHESRILAASPSRLYMRQLVETEAFQRLIVAVIVINAITLGLETSPAVMNLAGDLLHTLDQIALLIFVLELSLKLYAYGRGFFRSGWNIFDLVIVGIALIPAAGSLSVLRALRILRVARLFSAIPSMRLIIEALIGAIPGMGSIILVLALIFYICAVLATRLFGASFPEMFGTLGLTALTLFQLMTLDGWNGDIVSPVMEIYPWAWVFFIPFIVITAFAVLNLFIGVLLNNIESHQEERAVARDEALHQLVAELTTEVRSLRAELAQKKD
ncbi:MAG: ion transporter [Oscillochloridaceae bacterium umkhey_bin13]